MAQASRVSSSKPGLTKSWGGEGRGGRAAGGYGSQAVGEGVGATVTVTVVKPEGAEGEEGGAPIRASLSRLITDMPVTSGLHLCLVSIQSEGAAWAYILWLCETTRILEMAGVANVAGCYTVLVQSAGFHAACKRGSLS